MQTISLSTLADAERNLSLRDIKARLWDVEYAARQLPRFEFIAYFVARKTRRTIDRVVVNGFQLVHKAGKFYYRSAVGPLSQPTTDFSKLFDSIRRTPLNHYVKQAEDFRIEVLS